jgi:hypothetical protein
MAISTSHTIICDGCGADTGSSRPTQHEAIEYAQRGGWTVSGDLDSELYGDAVCNDCSGG